MYSLTIADDGRILSATFEQFNPYGLLVEELPEGNITDYKVEVTEATEDTERVVNYIYDPIPIPEPPTPEPTPEEIRFDEIETALTEVAEMSVDNEEAVSNINQQIAEIQDALVELAEMIVGE